MLPKDLGLALRRSGHDAIRANGELGKHHANCVICRYLDRQKAAAEPAEVKDA